MSDLQVALKSTDTVVGARIDIIATIDSGCVCPKLARVISGVQLHASVGAALSAQSVHEQENGDPQRIVSQLHQVADHAQLRGLERNPRWRQGEPVPPDWWFRKWSWDVPSDNLWCSACRSGSHNCVLRSGRST